MICGIFTAILNSAGYLFSSRFLLYYKSPARLLVVSSMVMLVISLLFLPWVFPFAAMPCLWRFSLQAILGSVLFLLGQVAFFAALRYFDASRIASLLGLKIIVLSVIFVVLGGKLMLLQLAAVVLATVAAVTFNWSGTGKVSYKGWLLLAVSLVCYSCVDMVETSLVMQVHQFSHFSKLRSALAVVPFLYTGLGVLLLPAVFFFKPDKDQVIKAFPYGLLWLVSQIFLFCCYSNLQPVFGNVILVTRGIFSVLAGILLPYFGLSALDSRIPLKLWFRRIIASLIMLGAIALYSFASL